MVDDAADGSSPLANGTIDLSGLAETEQSWVNFTFTPISITISSTYYIFVKDPTYVTTDDRFGWALSLSDVYSGGLWNDNPSWDGTFKTFYEVVTPEFDNFMLLIGITPIGILFITIYITKKR